MFAIIQAAGWPIWPLLLASVIAVALIIERSITLRRGNIMPDSLLEQVVAVLGGGRVGRYPLGEQRGQHHHHDHHEADRRACVDAEIVPELDQGMRRRGAWPGLGGARFEPGRHGYLACRMRGLISP